ncbi:MAG: biotin/lipoyl-binding protein [Candidatus Hydrogenedens sp.]|nr:biotin/lipoyl-binding protein [Candidatus Hydrogenedens sp.]
MATVFKLPELGENIASGTIGRLLVKAGDSVSKNQAVLEIETDKAVTEITAPADAKITEISVKEGDVVKVGQPLFSYEGGAAPAKSEPAPAKEAAPESEPEQPKQAPAPAPKPSLQVLERPAAAPRAAGTPVLASPSVRKLARELGVELNEVPTADPSGRVTAQDVMAFAKGGAPAPAAAAPAAPAAKAAPAPAPSGPVESGKWGPVRRETMNAVRKKTVEHMAYCWSTIPHVTHFEKADITKLEDIRKQYGKQFESGGGKLTVTVFLIKVMAEALRRFHKFNASFDVEKQEVLMKDYVNIGVAVDTPAGLLVPVIKDADQKSLLDIAIEVPQLAAKARDRKLSLDEMQGACMTITNLGGVGGPGFQGFTPIINAPEVAILGVSRAAVEPVFENGGFAPRLMMPMTLSYDHRLIDGADAARFMKWYTQTLEQPWTLWLDA